jgi:hypothetical protein
MHAVRFSRTGQFEQCHSYVVAAACLWPDRVPVMVAKFVRALLRNCLAKVCAPPKKRIAEELDACGDFRIGIPLVCGEIIDCRL